MKTSKDTVEIYRAQGAVEIIDKILELPADIREYQKQTKTPVSGLSGVTVAKKL